MAKNHGKKLLAKLLTLTMVLSGMIAVPAQATDTEINYIENFSTYAEGTNVNDISGWNVTATGEGDSVTVETDSETGSRAIKIVNASTSVVEVYADIPDIESGKYWYSFDFRAENDTRYIPQFGALRTDGGGSGAATLMSRVGYVYGPTAAVTVGGFNTSVNEFKVFVDKDAGTYKLYYNGRLKTQEALALNNVPGRISFRIENNATFNGTKGDASKPAVYWVDNVKIVPAKTYVADDFESHATGASPAEGNSMWNVTATGEGDSVTVETDSETGSKAIKIVNASTSVVEVYADIPDIESGKYWYSFDFRAENDTRYIPQFGALRTDGGGSGAVTLMSRVGYVYGPTAAVTVGGFNTSVNEFKVFVDKDAGTYKLYYNNRLKTQEALALNNVPGRISFRIENNATFNGTKGDATKPAVYWIDNVKIEYLELEAIGYTPAETSNVPIDSDISVEFNTEIAETAVSAEYFTVEADGIALAADEYSVSSADNTTVNITLAEGLGYGKEYKVTAKKGIDQAAIDFLPLSEDFTFTFTTEEEPVAEPVNTVLFEEDFEDHTEGDLPSVYNPVWSVTTTGEGDSVTVEADSVTGSRALKIVNASTEMIDIRANIPDITSGKYAYTFTFRTDNDTRYISRLGSLRTDNDWYGAISMFGRVGVIYDNVGTEYVGSIAEDAHEIKVIFDKDADTYQIYYDGILKSDVANSINAGYDPGEIAFRIENNATFNGINGDASKPAVYWLDDIKIELVSSMELTVSKGNEPVQSLENCAGDVTVDIALENVYDENYVAVIAVKNDRGGLEGITFVPYSDFTENCASKTVTIANDVTADWNIEVCLFESLTNIRPVTEKASLKKN